MELPKDFNDEPTHEQKEFGYQGKISDEQTKILLLIEQEKSEKNIVYLFRKSTKEDSNRFYGSFLYKNSLIEIPFNLVPISNEMNQWIVYLKRMNELTLWIVKISNFTQFLKLFKTSRSFNPLVSDFFVDHVKYQKIIMYLITKKFVIYIQKNPHSLYTLALKEVAKKYPTIHNTKDFYTALNEQF